MDVLFSASRGFFSFAFAAWADEFGRRDLCHGSKLTVIQPPSTTLDGTLHTTIYGQWVKENLIVHVDVVTPFTPELARIEE